MAKGPSQNTVSTQQAVTQEQLDLARSQQQASEEDRAKSQTMTQPLIDRETAIAGGDRSKALEAAMPVISSLTGGYKAAKDNIFNIVPPGAGRDKALADLEVGKAVGTGGALAGEFQKAPEILANIGQGYGAFSLQELGASLGGYAGASGSNQATGALQAKQSEAKWAPLLSIASSAGGAAGSYFGRK